MNGTVLPASSSSMAFAACCVRMPSSAAIWEGMFASFIIVPRLLVCSLRNQGRRAAACPFLETRRTGTRPVRRREIPPL